MIAVNLTGVWKTVKVAAPAMIETGNGGSIVITSSTGDVKGLPGIAHYVAAKHTVVGLMRSLANELAPHSIRVNAVHPTGVNTPMTANDVSMQAMSAAAELVNLQNALPVEMVEPVDISERHRVARLRGGPLRHRRVAAGGRRVPAAVTTLAAATPWSARVAARTGDRLARGWGGATARHGPRQARPG